MWEGQRFVYIYGKKSHGNDLTYPHPVTVSNKGLSGFPTNNDVILVTVTGWRVHPSNKTYTNEDVVLAE